jgi:hypothetical protein
LPRPRQIHTADAGLAAAYGLCNRHRRASSAGPPRPSSITGHPDRVDASGRGSPGLDGGSEHISTKHRHVTASETRSASVQAGHLTPTVALRGIVRVVADGTGRTPQEVWLLGAASIAVTITAAATRGVIRLVDWATNPEAGPLPTRRPSS